MSRKVELGVVRVAVEFDMMLTEDVAKREDVDNKQEGPQDRTLGHTSRNGEVDGFMRFELYELCPI